MCPKCDDFEGAEYELCLKCALKYASEKNVKHSMKRISEPPECWVKEMKWFYGGNWKPKKVFQCKDCTKDAYLPLYYCSQCGLYRCLECDKA